MSAVDPKAGKKAHRTESARQVARQLHQRASVYLANHREDLAFEATRQALELEAKLKADRPWRDALTIGTPLLLVAALIVLVLTAWRPAAGGGPIIIQPPPSGWPGIQIVLLLGLVAMVGLVLWKLFSDETTSGLTKMLGLAVPAIAGTVALEKLTPAATIPTSWPYVVFAVIWGVLVCVGTAILARSGDAAKPLQRAGDAAAGDGPVTRLETDYQSEARRYLLDRSGAAMVALGLAVLLVMPMSLWWERRAELRTAGSISTPRPVPVPEPEGAPGGVPAQPDTSVTTQTRMELLAEVWPFPRGEATVETADRPCTAVTAEERDALNSAVDKAVAAVGRVAADPKQSLRGLILVASTDRASLQRACLGRYTSNRGLAKARGETVRARLAAANPTVPITVVPVGPYDVGTRDVPSDRVVAVYGVVVR